MGFLLFSGILALIFGILLLAAPEKLKRLNNRANRLITDLDNLIYRYKQGMGICFLLSGMTLLFVVYYLYKIRLNVLCF